MIANVDWRGFLSDLPDISGVVLALVGVGITIMPEAIKPLERYRSLRFAIAGGCIVLGIGGLVMAHQERSRSKSAQQALQEEVNTLQSVVKQVRDISFKTESSVEAIQEKPQPSHSHPMPVEVVAGGKAPEAAPALAKPNLLGLRFVQEQVPSDISEFPYKIVVTIFTEKVLSPANIGVLFDGKFERAEHSVVGINVMMGNDFIMKNPLAYGFSIASPPVTPANPVRVFVYSKRPIHAVGVGLINQ